MSDDNLEKFEKFSETVKGLNLSPEQIFEFLILHVAGENESARIEGEEEVSFLCRIEYDKEGKYTDMNKYKVGIRTVEIEGQSYPVITRMIEVKSMRELTLKVVDAYQKEDYAKVIQIIAGQSFDIEAMTKAIKANGAL